jgi:hypothetical protein
MKEVGRLFSTDMVHAIMDGRKFYTRRLIKKFPCTGYKWAGWITDSTDGKEIGDAVIVPENKEVYDHTNAIYAKPPVAIGDRIYVRETWSKDSNGTIVYRADKMFDEMKTFDWDWCPSLFMPKAYARIWLEVTNVSVELIRNITDMEAKLEGFYDCDQFLNYMFTKYLKEQTDNAVNSILNSWVWVIDFKRIEH